MALNPDSKLTFFTCRDCGHNTPITEIGRRRNGIITCKACVKKATAIKDGTYRYNGATKQGLQRTKDKVMKKKYATGKLPKWMFS